MRTECKGTTKFAFLQIFDRKKLKSITNLERKSYMTIFSGF